jgi:hypothetical protein
MDVKTAIHGDNPPVTTISPKVKPTGIYPKVIGTPRFNPQAKSPANAAGLTTLTFAIRPHSFGFSNAIIPPMNQ